MTFKHGDAVTLCDRSGNTRTGKLHLPDKVYSGPRITPFTYAQSTLGGYGLHTIILSDGSRFRTQGWLS